MNKRLNTWVILQKFMDIRSGIILTCLCINTAYMGWYCLKHDKAIPEGYVSFLAVVFTGATIGKVTKTIKGQENGE